MGTEDGGGGFAAGCLQAGCLNSVCGEEMNVKCRVN